MSKLNTSYRVLAAAGLLGIAAAFVPTQDASAFGASNAFAFRQMGNGGFHAAIGGNRGIGGGRFVGGRMPRFGRLPGRLPPIVRLPPHHIPPIWGRPPRHHPPVIVGIPPRLPPPVIVRLPPRLPPPVIIGEAPPPVVGGRSVAVDQGIRPLPAMSGPTGCGVDGSFVLITFVPTVTAADITAFLKSYNVTMADGPNSEGVYRIRLSTTVLPENEVLKLVDSMRSLTAIVASVDGA